jgi:hypothetical protein
MTVARTESTSGPPLLIRAIWFVFVGWWLAGVVSAGAWLIGLTVIGLPLTFWILNRIPTVLTLRPRRLATTTTVSADGSQMAAVQSPVRQPAFWKRVLYFVFVGLVVQRILDRGRLAARRTHRHAAVRGHDVQPPAGGDHPAPLLRELAKDEPGEGDQERRPQEGQPGDPGGEPAGVVAGDLPADSHDLAARQRGHRRPWDLLDRPSLPDADHLLGLAPGRQAVDGQRPPSFDPEPERLQGLGGIGSQHLTKQRVAALGAGLA